MFMNCVYLYFVVPYIGIYGGINFFIYNYLGIYNDIMFINISNITSYKYVLLMIKYSYVLSVRRK